MADAHPASRDVDPEELRLWLREAAAAEDAPDLQPIVERARARLEAARTSNEIPADCLERVAVLSNLIADKDWIAPPSATPRALRALQYFVDMTSNQDGGDPCAMTEILAGDLRAELVGFREFSELRDRLSRQRFADAGLRERRLQQERRRIRARIQRRASDRGWLARLFNR